jgi:large repetitive protein
MPRSRWPFGVLMLGLAGALVGVVPGGVSAVAARARCRATAFVTNAGSGTVSTIDVNTRTKNPTDISVGPLPAGTAVTPDGKTLFVILRNSDTVSSIDVKTRAKNPTDIAVGAIPTGIKVTPDGKALFVVNGYRRDGVDD